MTKLVEECLDLVVSQQGWLVLAGLGEITYHHANGLLLARQAAFCDAENSGVTIFAISWMQIEIKVAYYLLRFIVSDLVL
jgi:hypothetical protein